MQIRTNSKAFLRGVQLVPHPLSVGRTDSVASQSPTATTHVAFVTSGLRSEDVSRGFLLLLLKINSSTMLTELARYLSVRMSFQALPESFWVFTAAVAQWVYEKFAAVWGTLSTVHLRAAARPQLYRTESSAMEPAQEVAETPAMDLGALLDAGDSATVMLVAGDTRLVAHKAVLAAGSPVFTVMFCHDTLEASSGLVSIPDVEGPVLRQLLTFLYTRQVPQLPRMAPQLLAVADKYGVTVLKALCEQQIAAQLDVGSAVATAVLAVRHCCYNLRQTAVNFIKANLVPVMATQGWIDALRSQPADVIELSRLLSDPLAETSMPATGISRATPSTQPHKDHGRTPASAAPPITPRPTPRSVGAAVSLLRSLSRDQKKSWLFRAAEQGDVSKLQILLAAGADMEARDENKFWRTPLHWAAAEGRLEAVRYLVENGAEIDSLNRLRSTPLLLAAEHGRTTVVQLLVESWAAIDLKNQNGMTPLHYASMNGHAEAAAVLLEAGADRGALDEDGCTPLDLAKANRHQQLINILR